MKNYKTSGEHMFLVIPVIFFIINLLFKSILAPYIDITYWWIMLFILYPIAHFLQFGLNTKFTQYIYHVVVVFSLFQLLFVFTAFIAYLIGMIFSLNIYMIHLLIIGVIVFLTGYIYSTRYFTKRIEIESDKITEKTRIVQISDVHAHGALASKMISRIITRINRKKPDIVMVTGDLLDYFGLPAEDSLTPFERIKCPIYYVYGNHERMLLYGHADYLVDESTMVPLVNDSVKFNDFQIIGIDDDSKKEMLKQLKRQQVDKKSFTILMQHQPENVEEASKKGFDLMLSGHTHAGQFFPMNLLFYLRWKYLGGKYEVGNMTLNVSPGTGTKSFPFRIFVRNEITIIDLIPKTK